MENRLTTRLITYWERIRKEENLPEIGRLNPAALDDVWPFCFRLTVEKSTQAAKTYRYDYVGTKITEIYGKNLTGQYATAQLKSIPGASVLKRMDELVLTGKPLEDEGQFINEKSKIVKYRACLLPFGTEKNGVTQIVAGLSWKVF